MDIERDPSVFAPKGCAPRLSSDGRSADIVFPADVEGRLEAPAERIADPTRWSTARYLWFDACNPGPHSLALTLSFWDTDNPGDDPDLVSTIGLLPGLPTRVTFPLEALGSQRMFLPRTPGKLKTVIHGNKVRNLARLAIGKKKCTEEQRLEIHAVHLASAEPPYPLPELTLIDELGQWAAGDWKGKTSDAASMSRSMRRGHEAAEVRVVEPWGQRKHRDGTGFFRTHHDGKRWWLLDPKGYEFYSVGVDCVRAGEGCNVEGIRMLCGRLESPVGPFADCWSGDGRLYNHAVANLIRVFGAGWWDAWSRMTRDNLARWGFNTVGNWSDPVFARASGLPWVYPMVDFPTTTRCIFRDFPDVFSPEYERSAETFARQMEDLREDRSLIGYFLRNEPEWAFIRGLVIAEELLETDFASHSRSALIRFLADRYRDDVRALNTAWGMTFGSFGDLERPERNAAGRSAAAARDLGEFSRLMVDRYVRAPSQTVRRVDPNHLNLGMRYGYISSDDLLAGSDCFDVFSINCYDDDPRAELEKAGRATGLPVMIGEFHFGALDRGLSATGIRGAATQADRGRAYRYYVERAASCPSCVGAHYFQYCEQPTLGRFDGENYDIGLVDVCQTPLEDFLQEVQACHRGLYRVATGETPPTTTQGRLIHPIFF